MWSILFISFIQARLWLILVTNLSTGSRGLATEPFPSALFQQSSCLVINVSRFLTLPHL
jgi:hypothetical protein